LVVALVQPRREAKPLEQEGLGAEGPEAWRQWATASQRNESAAEAVAAAIARVLGKPMGQERVNPGHCAVLTRSGWEARLVQKALSRRHIASVLRESGDVMESDEAAELATVMQAVLKPGKRGWRRAALATRLLGLNAAELACLSPEDEEAWQDRLAAWGDVWAKQGVAAFLAALDNEGGASQNLAQSHEGERRITDLRHLCEMLQAEGSASAGGPEHLLEWLQKAQASIDPVTAKERLRRLEQDSAAVQVLTQHAAKGLEFDLVFCPYLWSVRREKDERVVLRSGMPDKKPALVNLALLDPAARAAMEARVGWERLQEDLRLAYVALTRARRRAWVLAGWPGYAVKNSVVPPSALDWLLQAKPEGPSAGGSAWYSSMKAQKTVDLEAGFTCQQVAVCMDSQAFSQPLFSVASVDLGAAGDTQGQALPLLLKERQAPIATVPEWKLTSYSRLIDGSDQAQDRRDPEQAPVDEDESAERVPLAAFPAGARPGTCLHAVLEAWDFAIEPRELVHKALQDHGFAGPDKNGFDPVAALSTELPKWAKVRLEALDCTLGQAAADKAQSEIPFMLPLQPGGLDLQALAAVFRKHAADDEGRAYADSLLNIAQDQADSLLHGFIDRLLRHGQRWALIDWKSNKQGLCAKDYGPESLRRSAQEHHYVLQAHLYLVALRRFLMRRGQPFELVGGGLAYLRGLQAGTGQGLLWFRPSDAMLHELDALFAQGSLA
jgi:exodeoxyribonuclease V beta subunit